MIFNTLFLMLESWRIILSNLLELLDISEICSEAVLQAINIHLQTPALSQVQFNLQLIMVAAQVLNRVTPTSAPSTGCNEWCDRPLSDVICLFDVDGTLSLSRKVQITDDITLKP